MKIQLLLFSLIYLPTSLISMEAPSQSLEQKIAAAQHHNRTHCPLARLPREVQDYIAEYLEFNDRESDEEFIKSAPDNKPTTEATIDLRETISTPAEKILVDRLKPYEERNGYTSVGTLILYSRDKSKVLMAKNFGFTVDDTGAYYFLYDNRTNQILFSDFILDPSQAELVALSNNGNFFSITRQLPSRCPRLFQIHPILKITDDDYAPLHFNKQSTKMIRLYYRKEGVTPLCSEEEHKQKSKKTLALFLHQKGICRPFNYRQESA